MKVGVWPTLFFLLCFAALLAVCDTMCTDSSSYCSRDNICDQPGLKNRCNKTCGLCGDEPGNTTCMIGTWGKGCTERCSVGCLDRVCHKEEGVCECKPCYTGKQCTDVSYRCKYTSNGTFECNACWYGEGCKQNCNEGCLNKTCNSNGTCRLGCDPSRYGDKCDRSCSKHCVNETCNRSGSCTLGCDAGWFGTSCEQRCPENCDSDTCGRLDGSCTSCHDGYIGSHCNISCPVNCEGKTCNQTDGTCPACDDSWFGHHCNISCPVNCEGKTCNQTDGTCPACDDGWFGLHCNISCPENCEGLTCNMIDGTCSKCTFGWFGDKCEQTCSEGCQKKLCDQETLICTEGCLSGMYGEFCNMSCSARCRDKICIAAKNASLVGDVNPTGDVSTAWCSLGCEVGWFGHDCSSPCPTGCETCGREDGRCLKSRVSELVVWIVLPVLVITLLLIVSALLLARTKHKKKFKLCHNLFRHLGEKETIQISGFYPESPEDSPPLHSDKMHLLSMRQYMGNRSRDSSRLTSPNTHHESSFPLLPYHPQHPSPQQNHLNHQPPLHDRLNHQPPQQDRLNHQPPLHDRPRQPTPPPLTPDTTSGAEGPGACHVMPEGQPGCWTSTEVRLEGFRDYVEAMKLNLGLSNQFYDLPFGKLGPCEEGEKSSNSFKNRYRNILPYDHSRVKLESIDHIPDSDYINANYINGYGSSKKFVATQGPYNDVMCDFWRMVWEINCGKIVMLTNLVESRKVKCQQYWPEPGEKMDNDGVVVQSVSQMELPDYTIRTFALQMKGRQLRTIQQFHYTAWPDKGVPLNVMSLVDFHQSMKQAPSSLSGSIIVHCSAGVGRTGTFIALDYLVAQARAEGAVDVFECVTRLRHQRMDLIQTEDQYIFLHEALLEALPSGDRPSREIIGSNSGVMDAKESTTEIADEFLNVTLTNGSDHTYEVVQEPPRKTNCTDRNRKRPLPEVPQEDSTPDNFDNER